MHCDLEMYYRFLSVLFFFFARPLGMSVNKKDVSLFTHEDETIVLRDALFSANPFEYFLHTMHIAYVGVSNHRRPRIE